TAMYTSSPGMKPSPAIVKGPPRWGTGLTDPPDGSGGCGEGGVTISPYVMPLSVTSAKTDIPTAAASSRAGAHGSPTSSPGGYGLPSSATDRLRSGATTIDRCGSSAWVGLTARLLPDHMR